VSAPSDNVSRRRPRFARPWASDDACIATSSVGTHIKLRWALVFAIVAIVAGVLGFARIAAGAAAIAETLFYIFVGLAVVFIVPGITVAKKL
jgi:uncharacterized membrane protein YtjA (UPF0391 family)